MDVARKRAGGEPAGVRQTSEHERRVAARWFARLVREVFPKQINVRIRSSARGTHLWGNSEAVCTHPDRRPAVSKKPRTVLGIPTQSTAMSVHCQAQSRAMQAHSNVCPQHTPQDDPSSVCTAMRAHGSPLSRRFLWQQAL
eukprot:gene1845-biopygen65